MPSNAHLKIQNSTPGTQVREIGIQSNLPLNLLVYLTGICFHKGEIESCMLPDL